MAAVALGCVPWVLRNVLLSGCPFYPSPLGALPVDWRVQADAAAWITTLMVGGPVWTGLGNVRWAVSRLRSLGWLSWDVLVPTAIAIATIPVGLVAISIRLLRRVAEMRVRPLLVLLPALASFAFVGAAAPMPRYAGATFWLLAMQAVMLVIGPAAFEAGRLRRVVAGVAVLIPTGVLLLREPALLSGLTDFQASPPPVVSEVRLPSGLVVAVPRYGQCWDAPLPCARSRDPGLRLRRVGELGSGFVIDRSASPSPVSASRPPSVHG